MQIGALARVTLLIPLFIYDRLAFATESDSMRGGKKLHGAAGDHQRRIQRLQEILDELVALTDWKKL